MADNNQMKELLDKLDEGVKSLFDSEKYLEYLNTMSRFHNYSLRNTLLIHSQFPEAQQVAGYQSWKKNFNRQVKKGEKGIKILAPISFTETKEFEKLDPETKQPIIGEDGKPVMETLVRMGARFRTVSVFDLSQTSGDPLPQLVEPLNGDVERYELFVDTLKAVSPLPIVFEDMSPDMDGYCKFGDKIAIRNNMSEVQTVSAILHEMAHTKLHDVNNLAESEKPEKPKARRFEEIEAESVAWVISTKYDIKTDSNSFGYISSWSNSNDTKDLQESLDVIRKASAELIDSIDEKYQQLAKERGIDLTTEITQEEKPVEIKVDEEKKTEKPLKNELTALQKKAIEYGERHASLPLQDKLNIIAKAFNSKTATIERRLCTGKWRGCSDVSIRFDSGAALGIATKRTPETKKSSVINQIVNDTLRYHNPEIIAESKALATTELLKREINDNIIAAERGFKPYKFLNVEFNDGTHDASAGYIGWYSVTLAVGDKIINHINTGLNYDIAGGKVSEFGRLNYYTAGGLNDSDVDFVFGNVGFCSEKELYSLTLSKEVLKRAEETLAKRLREENITELIGYGYTDESMEKLDKSKALELFDSGETIYLLYDDNTENMALARSEIEDFEGQFGIEKVDFERIQATDIPTKKALGTFEIYQIRQDEEFHNIRFANMAELEKQSLMPNVENYDLVYTATLFEGETLDTIYEEFNFNHPIDFLGRSLSVSDVIVIKQQDNISVNFVDSYGFKEISDFFSDDKQTLLQVGTSLDIPTVAELEVNAKAGKTISLYDLSKAIKSENKQPMKKEKPDFLAKIDAHKQRVSAASNSAMQKNKNLEVE